MVNESTTNRFSDIRKEYEDTGIASSDLADCPFEEFSKWLNRAIENAPGRWYEPNAMTVATTDLEGQVTARTVLLKQHDKTGFVFYSNYDSEKGKQIEANSLVAILFHWHFLGQQIRINGKASKTTREMSEKYFHSRPRGAQISALASQQSSVVESREELAQQVTELEKQIGEAQVPLPESWGGYIVEPNSFEFWQGRSNRLHDRIRYSKIDNRWSKTRLSP